MKEQVVSMGGIPSAESMMGSNVDNAEETTESKKYKRKTGRKNQGEKRKKRLRTRETKRRNR